MDDNQLLRTMMSQLLGMDTRSSSSVERVQELGENEEVETEGETSENEYSTEQPSKYQVQQAPPTLGKAKCGCSSKHGIDSETRTPSYSRCMVANLPIFPGKATTNTPTATSPQQPLLLTQKSTYTPSPAYQAVGTAYRSPQHSQIYSQESGPVILHL